MKRLWVCALLLALSLMICVGARVGLTRTADREILRLEAAAAAVRQGNEREIISALDNCETYWKTESRPFYLFLDHNFFNDFEYKLFHLRDYATLEHGLALETIGYCIAVLRDQAAAQRPVFEHIF